MDYRKIIAFGKSSFVVSLPKTWLDLNKLKKGDFLFFEQEGDQLILSAKNEEGDKEDKKAIINIDNKDLDRIKREIYSAYLDYNDYIIIRGSNLASFSEEITNTISELMALEITEQTNEEIIAQDFLRITDVNLNEKLKKCDITLRSMLKDLSDPNFEDFESIIDRQKLVYRIYFVVLKIIKALFSNFTLLSKIDLNYLDLLNMYTAIFAFHDISRNIKLLAKFMKKLNSKERKSFSKHIGNLSDDYHKIIKVIHSKDVEQAFKYSNIRNNSLEKLDSLKTANQVYFKERITLIYLELHEMLKRVYS